LNPKIESLNPKIESLARLKSWLGCGGKDSRDIGTLSSLVIDNYRKIKEPLQPEVKH
jgi:hypothetical protein